MRHLHLAGFHLDPRYPLCPPDDFLQARAVAPKPVCREDSTGYVPQETAAKAGRGVERGLSASVTLEARTTALRRYSVQSLRVGRVRKLRKAPGE